MEFEPCDGSTLTFDELETLRALERQFADPDDAPSGGLGWRSKLGLTLWALGGGLAVASVWGAGAVALTIVAAVVGLAGFGLLVTEL